MSNEIKIHKVHCACANKCDKCCLLESHLNIHYSWKMTCDPIEGTPIIYVYNSRMGDSTFNILKSMVDNKCIKNYEVSRGFFKFKIQLNKVDRL